MSYLENNNYLKSIKERQRNSREKVFFLCIGSCKIIGDSVGPRVGSYLKQMKIKNAIIIGNMKKTVTAKNLVEVSEKYNLKDKYTVVIDSALGVKEQVGKIFITNNKLKLGKALNKDILEIGDISIKACVCENLYNPVKNYYELKKVNINLIEKLTEEIINGIC